MTSCINHSELQVHPNLHLRDSTLAQPCYQESQKGNFLVKLVIGWDGQKPQIPSKTTVPQLYI